MVVVDSTVWIDYLNGARTPQTEWLDREIDRQRLGLLDIILCEVLQGLAGDAGLGRHSITRSARDRMDGGIVRPSAFAVLRLMTNSNLVGCSMGRSPGLAPLRILSTYVAARRYMSATFGP